MHKKRKLLEQIGDGHLPYLSSKDDTFYDLWGSCYSKLTLLQAKHVPVDLHHTVQNAFLSLLRNGCLFQDLVRLKGKDIITPVSRILIGRPGYTYKYLKTRLFAVPWINDELNTQYSTRNLLETYKAFSDLNDFLYSQTVNELQKLGKIHKDNFFQHSEYKEQIKSDQRPSTSNYENVKLHSMESFNVTLINYMDPQNMSFLKEEPYFGMGKMAVSWHHDENLVEQSTVAVYNYSYQESSNDVNGEDEDPTRWHVGLKIAWDIETPGLLMPLSSGDCYLMLDDLNKTHQHCVIAGCQPRFSSTHRVAESSTGTLQYIKSQCNSALQNLHMNPDTGAADLKNLEPNVLGQTEEIHNEVEFEWLRQFWFQGKRYNKCTTFWKEAMTELEIHWKQMETMTSLVLKAIENENLTVDEKCNILKNILPPLVERQDLRHDWRERCRSKLAKMLPPDQVPCFYPYWNDDNKTMPLPFDLHNIISALQKTLEENELKL
ncbi:alpha-ketoglutarate-dependent dioxygenase FTO isoform X1 [Xenopus laevis]|uniref:Alpha-ketoglutarate-dependent dioxygenase FTO n=1 Tax=Xenopus laevis TaxID=8355 RepID=A0A8J1MU51_XENLA|nr:alpha-ketoglutarate-dependent dioxygenase FTO isoform X1 [Xenopus laevis]